MDTKIGDQEDPSAGLDDVKKRKFLTVPGLELLPISHPARNPSLYQLRYPGSQCAEKLSKYSSKI
jgi:hypothetical protein